MAGTDELSRKKLLINGGWFCLLILVIVVTYITHNLILLFISVILLSVIIWLACEPFSRASFYLGRNIPGSVRGATIDAIASSMPEFFTVLFFLIIFGTFESGIATCAGSAIYNMMVIPAICTFFIFSFRKMKGLDTDLVVEKEVLYRDGIYYLLSEIVLIGLISQDTLHWWMALMLVGLYGGYVAWLWIDTRGHLRDPTQRENNEICNLQNKFHKAVFSKNIDALKKIWPEFSSSELAEEYEDDPEEFWSALKGHIVASQNKKKLFSTDCEIMAQGHEGFSVDYLRSERGGMLRLNVEEEGGEGWRISDSIVYDHTKKVAWLTILIAGAAVGFACYWLTWDVEHIASELGVVPFFVALIIAAAATSVPDTFLSMLSAKKGDDSGAVSNAFGSNIFDVNIGLGLPLLIWTVIKGPVDIGGTGVADIRIILLVLSLITLVIFGVKLRLNRLKAIFLFGLYLIFMGYAFMHGWFGIGLSDLMAMAT